MDNIIWKLLDEESDGKYEISNTGFVKNRDSLREFTGAFSNGYKIIFLRRSLLNIRKPYQIHRLVGKYFVDNPLNKPQINHINGIKYDNRAENLEWVTIKENVQHAYRELSKGSAQNHYKTHLTNNCVLQICQQLPHHTYDEIAKKFNCSKAVIQDIASGRSWRKVTKDIDYIPYYKQK